MNLNNFTSSILKKPDIFIASLYSLAFTLVLTPYYNWFYRIGVNLIYFVIFPATLLLVFFARIPFYIYNRHFKKALLMVLLGLVIIFSGTQVDSWRFQLTNSYIQNTQCNTTQQTTNNLILGGIKEVRFEGVADTNFFVNDSHCLIVVCTEEFYTCHKDE